MQPAKKKKYKKKVMGKRLRSFVMILLGSGIIATAILLATYVMRISSVEVTGDISISADEVVQILDIQEGDTLFTYGEDEIRNRLLSNPYLELVKLDRKWPSRLHLELSERIPVAAVSYGGQYVLIDRTGTVLESVTDTQGIMTVVNVSPTAAMIGNTIQGLDEYQIKAIGLMADNLSKSDMSSEYTSIDPSQPASIMLGTKSGIKIRFGTADDFDKKIAWIDKLLPEVMGEGKTFGTIDVSANRTEASYIPND